ncbi:TetR/AcrR family transcriptional regulator [Paenibacillus sp. MMS20-IR301]|uniref:TetR/AcrR family transcriptional regulator n=1 Tax=Paenibacillus sp. MMS20-IR301 TaxID=2895946 RepID=UPI0028E1E362|nr:TetR/AcrR family transcriptional regulator [Paenibacillus sp. MMS20-IR301]WNS43204.1 TetR/AcrR family transcriptional regulator [Paenibacillus sp. MMS20-IR301]
MKDKPYHHGNLRNQLIEAGIKLINTDGISSFSLRKVAAECRVSHTAPYSHFKNIDELISAMGEHVTEQFMGTLHASVQGKEGSPEVMYLLGQAYIDFFMEHPQYFQFLYYHSGIVIDLDNYNSDNYPPFVLFRTTAYEMFHTLGLPEDDFSHQLITLWATVHGIASLLTNNGVHYSGNWRELLKVQSVL